MEITEPTTDDFRRCKMWKCMLAFHIYVCSKCLSISKARSFFLWTGAVSLIISESAILKAHSSADSETGLKLLTSYEQPVSLYIT